MRLSDALILEVGEDSPHHVARCQLAAANRGKHVLDILARQSVQHRLQAFLAEGLSRALEGTFKDAYAEPRELLANGVLGRAAYRGARLASYHHRLPGSRRHLRLGADDLHLVTVLQFGHQWHYAAVDLGANAAVADIGVDGIGEVDRDCAAWQRYQHALRREAEDLVLEQFQPGVLEEIFGIVAFRQLLDRAPQPGIGVGFVGNRVSCAVGFADAVLVERVGGNAIFGDLVHLPRAYLQFDALARRPDDGRVD